MDPSDGDPILTLCCDTQIGADRFVVRLQVVRSVWHGSWDAREFIRNQMRGALRHTAEKEIGCTLPETMFKHLPVYIEDPDHHDIVCFGGPLDGKELTIKSDNVSPVLQFAKPPTISLDGVTNLNQLMDMGPIPVIRYRLSLDEHGFPERNRKGAWKYVPLDEGTT